MKPRALMADRSQTGVTGRELTQALTKASIAFPGLRHAPTEPKRQRRAKANSRLNKTGLVLYIEPALNKLLKQKALDLDTSAHALGLIGLRLLVDELGIEVPASLLPADEGLLALAREASAKASAVRS